MFDECEDSFSVGGKVLANDWNQSTTGSTLSEFHGKSETLRTDACN